MALGQPAKGSKQSGGGTYPIAKAFAITILVALLALGILRHLFGSIRVEVGTR